MYWLFKRYMKRLIAEYKEAYDTEQRATLNVNMRPDFYYLEQYLTGKFEWKKSDDGKSFIRRGK